MVVVPLHNPWKCVFSNDIVIIYREKRKKRSRLAIQHSLRKHYMPSQNYYSWRYCMHYFKVRMNIVGFELHDRRSIIFLHQENYQDKIQYDDVFTKKLWAWWNLSTGFKSLLIVMLQWILHISNTICGEEMKMKTEPKIKKSKHNMLIIHPDVGFWCC